MIDTANAQETPALRAAEYVRMSTEQQQFSIAYQQAAIRLYAAQRGLTVVKTYADESKSGLTLDHRPALIQLLRDVERGSTDFDLILVYDVSRWGRWQDTDEAAHHEFRCRQAGKHVEYCAEQFVNDGGPITAVMKAIKRAMAAEYSRELAVKVAASQRRAFAAGYFHGGPPGYGLRRMRIDAKGNRKGLLQQGDAKASRTERIILVPGPAKEVETVRRIFRLYVRKQKSAKQIASTLNAERRRKSERIWLERSIHHTLSNERYTGVEVRNRTTSGLLLGRRDLHARRNDQSKWIRRPLGSPGIVSREVFKAAQARKALFNVRYPDETALLSRLRVLLVQHGKLTSKIINLETRKPKATVFQKRFGGLRAAYARIGYIHPRDWTATPAGHNRLIVVTSLLQSLRDALLQFGVTPKLVQKHRKLVLPDGYSVVITAAPCRVLHRDGALRWILDWHRLSLPDLTIIARLNCDGTAKDYLYLQGEAVEPYANHYFGESPELQPYLYRTVSELTTKVLSSQLQTVTCSPY